MRQYIQSSSGVPVGPYTPALRKDHMLFISGQIAPEKITASLEEEVQQVMQQIENLLREADMGWQHVVKTTILLLDISDFSQVNAVYQRYFEAGKYPARETYAVKALPKAVRVEISAIAIL